MKRIIFLTTIISVLLCICFGSIYYYTNNNIIFSLAITFLTISYHFIMRLLVGLIINSIMKNKADYNKRWFKTNKLEEKWYQFLKIKKWKKIMPNYEKELFDPKLHSWEDILMAMCQAEVVHEIIMILSYIPLIFSIWFNEFIVFLITSILASLLDYIYVMMQRYNRNRIFRIVNKNHSI